MGTEAQLHFHKTCQSASPFKGLIRHSFPALNSTCVSTTFPSSVASRDLWKPEADGDLLTHLPFMADFSFQASSVSHYSVYLHDIRQSLEHLVNPKRLFTHEFQHGQSQPSHKTNQREGWGSGAFLTPTTHALGPSNGYRHVKHVITVKKQHKRTYVTARLPTERAILVPSSFLLGILILPHRNSG